MGKRKRLFEKSWNAQGMPFSLWIRMADHWVPEESGITSLHAVAWKGTKQEVAVLLSYGVDPNVRDNDGWVPLHDAVMRGHYILVDMLLHAGAHINSQDDYFKYTPLHHAARLGYSKIITLLINEGACLDLRDYENLTAQECAEMYGQHIVAQQLASYRELKIQAPKN